MPKTANGKDAPESSRGNAEFLFVSLTGERTHPYDRATRKTIRTHVMRNYLEHNPAEEPEKPAKPNPVGGEKMRFRLKHDKLEQTIPYRRRTKAATVDGKGSSRMQISSSGADLAHSTSFRPLDGPRYRKQQVVENVHVGGVSPVGQELGGGSSLASNSKTRIPEQNYFVLGSIPSVEEELEDSDLNLHMSASPLQWFGNSRIDTLGVLPFALSPFDEILVDRFQKFEPLSWCPVNGQSLWFPYAMNDPLLFHATMYNFSMHFNNVVPDFIDLNPGVLVHKQQAILMINDRISDPIEAVKDENVASVVAMVCIEIAYGSAEDAAKHMKGLAALIDMRGGIESLKSGIGGLLQRLTGWTDLNYAELFNTPLRFTKECEWDRVRAEGQYSCFRSNLDLIHAREPRIWQPVEGQVVPLLHEVRQLCDEVAKKPTTSMTELEKMNRSDRLHSIERQLRILTEKPEGHLPTSELVWRACASAGLIYAHHVLRGLPLGYRQFDTLSNDLMLSLRELNDVRQAWSFAPELLLWALSVGTIISFGREQHRWFAGSLAEACNLFGYTEWVTFRDAIKSFLWVDGADEERYFWVWQITVTIMTAGTLESTSPQTL